MENSLSLAAIEAELKPKVVETFDNIADAVEPPSASVGRMVTPSSVTCRSVRGKP